MKFDSIFEKNASDMAYFLKTKGKKISDKDVSVVFRLRYNENLRVDEYSKLLSMLENLKLLNKSVNSAPNFYQEMHKKLEESAKKDIRHETDKL